jgi:hypothetical protein
LWRCAMQRVQSVEKADAFLLKSNPPKIGVVALGTVASTGWTNPDLGPWFYLVPPKDGIQDFDFYATEPTRIVIPMTMPIAASLIIDREPDNYWGPGKPLVGVRIHAQQNLKEAQFGSAPEKDLRPGPLVPKGGDMPFPYFKGGDLPFSYSMPPGWPAPQGAPYPWPWPWAQPSASSAWPWPSATNRLTSGPFPWPWPW